jgi:hypothetical protein
VTQTCFGSATKTWVSHISLVFCEMWDTTAFDLQPLEDSRHPRQSTGAPRSPQRTWAENDGRSPTIALAASTDKFILAVLICDSLMNMNRNQFTLQWNSTLQRDRQ